VGVYANLVIFPRPLERRRFLITKRSIPQPITSPEKCVGQVVSLFDDLELLNVSPEELLKPREVLCYSTQVSNDIPVAVQTFHRQIRPIELSDRIATLVPTMTEAEVHADVASEEELSDDRFLPWIDVTATNEIVEASCDGGSFHSWLFVEFCYPDIRFDPETHALIDEHHELISRLEELSGAEMSNAIITY
jgi:hypothetical protein